MPLTYQAIATVTVGAGGASEVKFINIPASFTDLALSFSLRTAYAANWQQVPVYFNNDSSNTTGRNLYGTGSSVASNSASWNETSATGSNATASTFSSGTIYIPNYASTTQNKSFLLMLLLKITLQPRARISLLAYGQAPLQSTPSNSGEPVKPSSNTHPQPSTASRTHKEPP